MVKRFKGRSVPRLAAVAAVAAGVALVTACSSSGSAQPGSSSTSAASPGGTASASQAVTAAKAMVAQYEAAPTTIPQTTPLSSPAPKGKSIIYLNDDAVPSLTLTGGGVQAAAQALGWGYSTLNEDVSSPASVQAALEEALVKKPSGVVLLFPTNLLSSSVIKQYEAAGVPIAIGSNPIDTPSTVLLGPAMNLDFNSLQGKLLASWMIADSGGTGRSLMVGIPSFPSISAVMSEYSSVVKGCSGCSAKALNITLQQVAAGSVSSAVVSAIQADPGIKYVFFADGEWGAGITQALKAAGLNSVKVGGVTPTTDQMSELRTGAQSAWIGLNYNYLGESMVDLLVRKFGNSAGSAGDDLQPIQILTPQNVGTQQNFNAPADSLDQFKTLWKISA
jgi:ribose transport system substrate-binding protein